MHVRRSMGDQMLSPVTVLAPYPKLEAEPGGQMRSRLCRSYIRGHGDTLLWGMVPAIS